MKKRNVKRLTFLALLTILILGLTGCDAKDLKPKDESEKEVAVFEVSGNSSKDLEAVLGEWDIVADKYNGEVAFAEDRYYSGELLLYKEDGKYRADFGLYIEGSTEIFGAKVEVMDGALYGNCKNQSWYADIYHKEKEDSTRDIKLTAVDTDTLEVMYSNTYTYQDDLGNTQEDEFNTIYYLRRRGVDSEAFIYDLRYPETYEVSNVSELYNAIGSNRKIIVKAGTYNFSELPKSERNNDNINWYITYDYDNDNNYDVERIDEDQVYGYDIHNLIIEGEEGADVHICTNTTWVAPITFESSSYITLKNLRIGHNAERGMCAGSVLYFQHTSNVEIDSCRLYGCGTYGVWANYLTDSTIKNTEIYECSYGIMDLTDCWNVLFENCVMRDSEDLSMFKFDWCSSITLKDCIIKNNKSAYDYEPFIFEKDGYGEIIFDNCTFDNNSYVEYLEGNVIFK